MCPAREGVTVAPVTSDHVRAGGAASGGAAPPPRAVAALLVDRTFGPWFWGNLASNTGNWLYNVVAAVVVFDLTGSALMVGTVSVAQFATLAVVSPWAGALSDRIDRKRMLLAAQTFAFASASALAVASLLLGVEGLPGAWPIIVATLGIGVGVAFTGPAQQALVPALVEDADLESAVTLTSLTFNVGRALGPGAAGVILATVGPEVAFAVNAVTFVALLAALLAIRPRARAPHDPDADRSVRAGLRHLRRDPAVPWLLGGVAAMGFATDPINTLAPPLAAELGAGGDLVAVLVSAFGVGAALTALIAGRLQRGLGRLRTGALGGGLLAAGLLVAAIALAPWVAVGGFGVMGVGFVLGLTSLTTVLQRRVPDELRGRIMALWTVAFLGNRPIAALIDGALADWVGPRLAMGVPMLVALLGGWAALRLRAQGVEPRTAEDPDPGAAPSPGNRARDEDA